MKILQYNFNQTTSERVEYPKIIRGFSMEMENGFRGVASAAKRSYTSVTADGLIR